MKNFIKNNTITKYLVIILRAFKIEPSIKSRLLNLRNYFNDIKNYNKLIPDEKTKLSTGDLFPRIFDRTSTTKLDPVYYIQGTWCARKIFDNKPKNHVDIGSQAQMVGIISQFVSTTMVDIRPLTVTLPELKFVKGDITNLPFKDESIDSLSSICVIEHIGLGRYGDTLDPQGTEKSAKELVRVLAKNGRLYITVPIDKENKTYFNAHRAFTPSYIFSLFKQLTLTEEKYIYGSNLEDKYDPQKGFGTGLYVFIKKYNPLIFD